MIRFVDTVAAETRPTPKAAKAPSPQPVTAEKQEPTKLKARGRKTGA